jgi:hypothetical protein
MKVFRSHFPIEEVHPTTTGHFGKLGMSQLTTLLFLHPLYLIQVSIKVKSNIRGVFGHIIGGQRGGHCYLSNNVIGPGGDLFGADKLI